MRSNFRSIAVMMMIGFSAILASSVSVGAQTAHAIDTGMRGRYSIGGHVLMPSGQRVNRNVRIRLGLMVRADVIGMTNDVGNFRFTGLVHGQYMLHIDEKDYEPVDMPIEIVETIGGAPPGDLQVSIKLTHRKRPSQAASVVNAALASVPQTAQDLYNKAGELSAAKDYKGAIEQLKLAIQTHPEFMLAHNELGVQYWRVGDLDRAIDALRAALRVDPNAVPPLVNSGMVNFYLKRYGEAVPPLRKALKIREDSPICRYFLGRSLAYLGDFDQAEKELLTALKIGGPEMREAHRILAIIYSSRGEKRRAIAQIENYLKLAPNTPDAAQLEAALKKLKEG